MALVIVSGDKTEGPFYICLPGKPCNFARCLQGSCKVGLVDFAVQSDISGKEIEIDDAGIGGQDHLGCGQDDRAL